VFSGCIGNNENVIENQNDNEDHITDNYQNENNNEGNSNYQNAWTHPWDSSKPVVINGQKYTISGIKYYIKTRETKNEPIYEYNIEKRKGYTEIDVYGNKINMESGSTEKVNLGKYKVYEYYCKITPINQNNSKVVEYYLWYKDKIKNPYFFYPTSSILLMGMNDMSNDLVGIKIKVGDKTYVQYNPSSIDNMDVSPYSKNNGLFGYIQDGINIKGLGATVSIVHFNMWETLGDMDLTKYNKKSESFMGMNYNIEVNPKGTTMLGGKTFKVSEVKWNYNFGGITRQGNALISPNLPIPIETEGIYITADNKNSVYCYLKINDISFEKI